MLAAASTSLYNADSIGSPRSCGGVASWLKRSQPSQIFCVEEFQLRRIYAEPFANDRASARVLEKAGFAFEGRLKNNVLKDGIDSLLYARTK